jgi:hypothetical protein
MDHTLCVLVKDEGTSRSKLEGGEDIILFMGDDNKDNFEKAQEFN